MKFSILDTEITAVPLSTRQSRHINTNIQNFAKTMRKTEEGKLEAQDNDVARFLVEQTQYLLRNVYNKNEIVPENIEEFEDKVTLEEVCTFLQEQIEKSGTSDFLIQPLNALLSGMMKVTASVPGIVAANAEKAIQAMRT